MTTKPACLILCAVSLLAAALPAVAQQPAQPDIFLICPGTGQHLESHTSYGSEWDSKHDKYVDKDRTTLDTTDIKGTAQVEIRSNMGRIHPPERLVPPLSSGGQDGWWPLANIEITPDFIRASYRLNAFNKPTVNIDRRTGQIKLDGTEHFEGTCSAVDPNARKF
ncbi:MAG: hypothetical protein ABWX83_03040 [Luteibacter sp.]